jgi:AcrR family transcriptional regulator
MMSETKKKPENSRAEAKLVQPKPIRPLKVAKPTRAEKATALRIRILDAAAQVIGDLGYQDASVSRITQLAGIAQGTFYLYFETRQHLFDQVLPHAGQDMMRFIRDRVKGAADIFEVEHRGICAFFDYLEKNQGFYRLLNEAEFAAPLAHRAHMAQLEEHYMASLRRAQLSGHLKGFDEEGLRATAYTAMAARSYLYLAYVKYGHEKRPPQAAIDTYMSLLHRGMN